MTAIECVSVSGAAITPLITFEADDNSKRRTSAQDFQNSRCLSDNGGLNTGNRAYESLTSVFEPQPKLRDLTSRRLLLLNSNSSPVTAKLILHCMENENRLLLHHTGTTTSITGDATKQYKSFIPTYNSA
jgi:uncharacterized protein YcgI (DUF1989 family)